MQFRFLGDQEAAAALVSSARLIAGQLIESMQTSGTKSMARTVRVEGGEIRVLVNDFGGALIPIATITADEQAASAARRGRAQPALEGFILTPFSEVYPPPDGLDAEHPEILLSPIRGERGAYACWFSDAATDASEIARIPRRYLPLAPEGFREFGEIDWRGPDGLSLSFHGPESRYFPNVMVKPSFGTRVYSCGRVLFDGAEYASRAGADPRSAWPIAGAAIFGEPESWRLVCVHADSDTIFDDYPYSHQRAHLRSDFAIISYPVDLASLSVSDGHSVEGSFIASREGVPFLFSRNGRRASRIVSKTDVPLGEPYDAIERIGDSWEFSSTPIDRPPGFTWSPPAVNAPATGSGTFAQFIGGACDCYVATPFTSYIEEEKRGPAPIFPSQPVAVDYIGDDEVFVLASSEWTYSVAQLTRSESWSIGPRVSDAPCDCPAISWSFVVNEPFLVFSANVTLVMPSGRSFQVVRASREVSGYSSHRVVDIPIHNPFGKPSSSVTVTTGTSVTQYTVLCSMMIDARHEVLAGHVKQFTRHTDYSAPSSTDSMAYWSRVLIKGVAYDDSPVQMTAVEAASAGLAAHEYRPGPAPFPILNVAQTPRTWIAYHVVSRGTSFNRLNPGDLMTDRVREKDGRSYFGTLQHLDGITVSSMASFSQPFFNTLTASLLSSETGVQGAASFFPGSVMPRYLPES